MPTSYYDIYYADGGHERVYRQEDMLACRMSGRKIKSIKHYRYTENGWKVRTIL